MTSSSSDVPTPPATSTTPSPSSSSAAAAVAPPTALSSLARMMTATLLRAPTPAVLSGVLHNNNNNQFSSTSSVGSAAAVAAAATTTTTSIPHATDGAPHHRHIPMTESRSTEAMKQLLCGGVAGAVAKTVTAPLSRLTILFQVHPLVTTHENRPKFAMTLMGGISKIVERGGIRSLWKGNLTSVLHRFPYSAINFYVYENTLDVLAVQQHQRQDEATHSHHPEHPIHHVPAATITTTSAHPIPTRLPEQNETPKQLARRVTRIMAQDEEEDDNDEEDVVGQAAAEKDMTGVVIQRDHHHHAVVRRSSITTAADVTLTITTSSNRKKTGSNSASMNGTNTTTGSTSATGAAAYIMNTTPASHKFIAGAMAGTVACLVCYPLDLVRTRLTTELEGHEHYRGIVDAFRKIHTTEGIPGFYSGVVPTLLVAVPNFAISYTVYGTLKEHALDDELFYNLRKIDDDSGEPRLGFLLTLMCGAASGIMATLVTFPMDTIRRRMQIQALHIPRPELRKNAIQLMRQLVHKEGLRSLYWGLTPELLKVIPMVGTMFTVYEWTKEVLHISHDRR